MKVLGERGRWVGVAVAVLVLGAIGAVLLTGNGSAKAAAAGKRRRGRRAASTTTSGGTPLRALHPVAGKFKPDDTTVDSCSTSGDFACWEQALGNVAYKDGWSRRSSS